MNGAEVRARRLLLGLSQDQLGALLRPAAPISGRTVRRWEDDSPIPDRHADRIRHLTTLTDAALADLVAAAEAGEPIAMDPGSERVNVLRPGPGGLMWPASWWRMLAARTLARVPGAPVVYDEKAGRAES